MITFGDLCIWLGAGIFLGVIGYHLARFAWGGR